MTRDKKTLSPATQRALERLTKAAQWWGWEQDEGNGAEAKAAETEYNGALAAMQARLLRLENTAATLRAVAVQVDRRAALYDRLITTPRFAALSVKEAVDEMAANGFKP